MVSHPIWAAEGERFLPFVGVFPLPILDLGVFLSPLFPPFLIGLFFSRSESFPPLLLPPINHLILPFPTNSNGLRLAIHGRWCCVFLRSLLLVVLWGWRSSPGMVCGSLGSCYSLKIGATRWWALNTGGLVAAFISVFCVWVFYVRSR